MTDEPTLEELKSRAAELEIAGRSSMTKPELSDAIAAAELARDENAPQPEDLDVVGRPPLVELAEQRAERREARQRVIGGDTTTTEQED